MVLRGEPAEDLPEHGDPAIAGVESAMTSLGRSWRIDLSSFRFPEGGTSMGRKRGIAKYYKKQEKLLKYFSEMESFAELGSEQTDLTEGEVVEEEMKRERRAISISNIANLSLFVGKMYVSISSRSLSVIASTLDSLLDLLSGFILWFTSNAMKKPNLCRYPIGKKRMQPVGIIVFASVMATLGLQILLESGQQIIASSHSVDGSKLKWIIGIMSSVTAIKLVLMLYCRRFKNKIIKAYAQDHFFDVITNAIGLITAVLAVKLCWWIDPLGAILIAIYTMITWVRTVMENVRSLISRSAPAEYLTKLTYIVWNHHQEIRRISAVRAYTFGSHYFVEVDIVLRGNLPLRHAHAICTALQRKLSRLPEVERAFVQADFDELWRFI